MMAIMNVTTYTNVRCADLNVDVKNTTNQTSVLIVGQTCGMVCKNCKESNTLNKEI